ncbi:MAG: ANTAR domain-containing protein [Pseudomonadota bacterium]
MRIAIIDESRARAAIIEEGLRASGDHEIFLITERLGLARRIEETAPDVILIDLGNPSRDMLEEYFSFSRAVARPIAMFVDQSDEDSIGRAIDAGVSAYVVDGMREDRIKPILDLAIRRFSAFSALERELEEARTALSERQIIDRAKAILMQSQSLNEPEAYTRLRSHAMETNRKIVQVAEALVTAHDLMNPDPKTPGAEEGSKNE